MFRGTHDAERDESECSDMNDIGEVVSTTSDDSDFDMLSPKVDDSILKLTAIGKGTLRWYQIISVCGFGTLVSAVLLSPAIMYTVLQSGQYVISIVPRECDLTQYQGSFPSPIRDFYSETAEFTSVAEHTHWYLGEWRAYPNARGLCPIMVCSV